MTEHRLQLLKVRVVPELLEDLRAILPPASPNDLYQPRPKAVGCMPKSDGTAWSNPVKVLEKLTFDLCE